MDKEQLEEMLERHEDRQTGDRAIIGRIKVRSAILTNACINTDCVWHTCHWTGLYENGCYMYTDISYCCDGTPSGFQLYLGVDPYKEEEDK